MSTPLEILAESLLDALMLSHPLRSRPKIVWKNLRVTAGVAYFRANVIGLSRNLLVDEERLRSTLIHEYAHLLAVERHGAKAAGHGEAWKRTMRDLGVPPERTHCYDVDRNVRRQKVIYQCLRCGAQFSRARRLPKSRKYVHSTCGGSLKLVSVEKVTKSVVNP